MKNKLNFNSENIQPNSSTLHHKNCNKRKKYLGISTNLQ